MSAAAGPDRRDVTGEGGSGGALALGVGDRVLMLENSYYSVISPEGCATILFKDARPAPRAAAAAPDRRPRPAAARRRRRRGSRAARRGTGRSRRRPRRPHSAVVDALARSWPARPRGGARPHAPVPQLDLTDVSVRAECDGGCDADTSCDRPRSRSLGAGVIGSTARSRSAAPGSSTATWSVEVEWPDGAPRGRRRSRVVPPGGGRRRSALRVRADGRARSTRAVARRGPVRQGGRPRRAGPAGRDRRGDEADEPGRSRPCGQGRRRSWCRRDAPVEFGNG